MKTLQSVLSPQIAKQMLDLGLYGRTDYVPFIVLGRSRVGSNLLRGLLNAHPAIETFGEIFKNRENFDWDHLGYFQSGSMRSLLREAPARFLHAKVFGRYPGSVRAVGFKLFYYHAREGTDAPVWPYLLQRQDLRVLHLKRRNLLHTHLSRKRAAMTGQWVDTSGSRGGPVVVELDYQECLDDFTRTRAQEAQADRDFAGHRRLEVEYERLAADYEGESRTIQAFLQVEPHAVAPTTFQQTREPLSATIANYAALKARFAGTIWAEFFTD